MFKFDKDDRQLFNLLLTPSWLSGLIAIGCGLILTIGVITAFNVNNSAVQQQLTKWQQDQPAKPLTTPDQTVTSEGRPKLKDSWPLLVVWSGIGLAVYILMASVVHSLSEAEALRESLGYVNANPKTALEITAGHVALRIVAFAGLIVLARIFYKEIIPYAITAAHASAVDIISITGILYAVLSCAIVIVSIHLLTIFLRLSLGRTRTFSGNI
jgi:hypothetical protein